MELDWLGFQGSWHIGLPTGFVGLVLLAFYMLSALAMLAAARNDFGRLGVRGWSGMILLAAAGFIAAQVFVFRFPADILPPPGLPVEPQRPGLALFALAPAFLAGGWLGVGPALLVGLVTGMSRAAWETYTAFTPFEYAFLAALVAAAVRQAYAGRIPWLLRQPVVAGLVIGCTLWLFLFFSYFAYAETAGVAALDYVVSITAAAFPIFFGQSLIAGLVAEGARVAAPGLWPRPRELRPAPYVTSLNRKLLFTLIPIFLVGIVSLFWAVLQIANDVSTRQALEQMSRAAENTGRDVPFVVQTGGSVIREIAGSRPWLALSPLDQTAGLLQSMRSLAFFKQVTLVDAAGARLATAGELTDPTLLPVADQGELTLITRALSGAPGNSIRFVPGPDGGLVAEMLFATPVLDPASQQPVAVAVGVTDLSSNPLMQSSTETLQRVWGGEGLGMIVDEQGRILFHSDPTAIGGEFVPVGDPAHQIETVLPDATAYRDRAPDGTRQIVLLYPVPGHPWTVVLAVPNRVVVDLAAQIAWPIGGILALIGSFGLLAVWIVANQITRPATELAHAAQTISDGQLDQPVQVSGDDEIGRAGRAFEHMRRRLDARLKELDLLLRVSQSVSSNLNLAEALPPILRGALKATSAAGARIVLVSHDGSGLNGSGQNIVAYAEGPAAETMAALDRQLVDNVRQQGRLIFDNLARTRALIDPAAVAGKIGSLVALPLRQEQAYFGVFWLAYEKAHVFSDAELTFLQTLAAQASVAVDKGRLFDAAEQGRRRLAATLASTPDSVIVTDRANRLVLINPEAEHTFQLTGQNVSGRPLAEVLGDRALVQLILEAGSGETSTGEFQSPSGRTLYAIVSPIINADGTTIGRVCVLRDVTKFKELDTMKSEFVATVSHDLRAPLQIMRGYASMIQMVGPLNDKQREFSDRITTSVEQMVKLIDDLLDLGRIEANVGMVREPVKMAELAEQAVTQFSEPAASRNIKIALDAPSQLPVNFGDTTFLSMAVRNLVDNAVKYTPAGGTVQVSLGLEGDKIRVQVSDTGIGIAPADQVHLFERFFRVKQRGTTSIKGSGLGLAIVKSIVERHGGRVWMESRLGKGSTFAFEVPVNPAG